MPKFLLALIALAALAAAQAPRPDLMPVMQQIAQDLGVSCNYCHSAERGSGAPEPKKDIARQMMAMTRDLNTKVQSATGNTTAKVECVTCHRGIPIPRQLTDIVTATTVQKGAAEAVEQYRDLHSRFYGRQAYDFGEDTLIAVATKFSYGKPDDAITLLKANLEFYPKSAKTLAAIGFAYTRKLDDETAISYLEKAVELEPNNGIINGQLVQLKSYRRRK